MVLLVKVVISLIVLLVYVLSGTFFFRDLRQRHPIAYFLAGLFATLGGAFLVYEIYQKFAPYEGWPLAVADGGGHRPAETFRDCPECPEMAVLPAGRFLMGVAGRRSDTPQRSVSVARFALATTEVTFDQWGACVADGGCVGNQRPNDRRWGREDRPVMNISWDEAQEYITWLNGKTTGAPYRLPSDAEWEYAARAGTETPYWWGDAFDRDYANGRGSGGADQWEATAPVGRFPANPFGLRDMLGNVREWTADCDGLGGCSEGRIVRGGAWNSAPRGLRAANRTAVDPFSRSARIGFRPAKALSE